MCSSLLRGLIDMETRKDTNYVIDWKSNSPKAIVARAHYLRMLRALLTDLENIDPYETAANGVQRVFKKYNVYFLDIDELARVNLDEPSI